MLIINIAKIFPYLLLFFPNHCWENIALYGSYDLYESQFAGKEILQSMGALRALNVQISFLTFSYIVFLL